MRYDINWQAAYDAYLASGLNVTAFTRRGLDKFNNSALRPCVETVRTHFKKIAADREKAVTVPDPAPQPNAAKAASNNHSTFPAANAIKPTVRVVTLTREDLARANPTPGGSVRPRRAEAAKPPEPTLFRMRLANGTDVEFETSHPEQLALEMVRLSGGPA